MKWMRCSGLPALPVQATSARGRCLRGLRAQSGREAARRRGSGIEGLRPGPARAQRRCRAPRPQPPAPPAPRHSGSGASPPGGGAEPGWAGGCRTHPAAAPATPQLRRIGGAVRPRSAHGERDGAPGAQKDGRTPPHTQTHTARRGSRHTHAHTYTLAQTLTGTHADTRTLAREPPPACPPARLTSARSPAPGARSGR